MGGVWESATGPQRERFRRMTTPTRANMRRFQWAYLLVSMVAGWISLGVLERHFAENWVWHALLSVFYLGAFLLLVFWLVPRETLFRIVARTSRMVKFAMVFNYLTLLFLMQMLFAAWWTRAVMLGTLFVITWFGAWIFWRFAWPMSTIIAAIFMDPADSQRPFEPRDPQGRNVRMD